MKNRIGQIIILSTVAAILTSSCATIFGNKDKTISVKSQPSGARVSIDGVPMGKTPATFQVPDIKQPMVVTVKKRGYEADSRVVRKEIQTVAFCNLLNLVCWGVDYITGNMYEIKSKDLHFDLEKK